MNTEFENMALLNIEDYNELKAKAEEMAKPEVVTLKVCFDTIANLERRLLKHALANVILSIISVAAIIALFTLIQN